MNNLEPAVTEQRRQTRNRIYRYILESEEPVSKHQMVLNLGYSLPTIYQNVQELSDAGLIRIGAVQKSTGGRPPQAYEAVADARYAIGVSISSNHIRMLALDLKGRPIAYKSTRVENDLHFDERVSEESKLFIQENHLLSEKILGIGITIPGVFDTKNDRIVSSPTVRLSDFSMQRIRESCDYPLYIVNDSKAAGLAELLLRPAEIRKRPFAYLLLENGVGGALAFGGHILKGDNNRCAEFGHMCVEPGGRKCNCGRNGCLEAYCSANRFTRDIGLSAEEFFEKLASGDRDLEKLWEDVLLHLSIGIVNIRMSFDCDIILGGFVAEFMEDYLPHLKELVAERDPFSQHADYLSIGKQKRAGMVGAAWHFNEKFINKI